MNPVDWALGADVPHAEKLVLVYLATRANRVGVGLWDRDELETTLGYKRRSVQRILKALRDADLLVDAGDWYVLQFPHGAATAPPADLELAPASAVPAVGGRPMTLAEIAGDEGGSLVSDEELERIKEAISSSTIDSVEYLVDQLSNFEARLGTELGRFLQNMVFHVEHQREEPPAPPPPDPVMLDPRYDQLVDMGFPHDEAYERVAELHEREGAEDDASAGTADDDADGVLRAGSSYPDSFDGRLQRVADILGETVTQAHRVAWQQLEGDENRHTVKGETPAFELLYPAIVTAARGWNGSLDEFLDFEAIKQSNAPWDRDPAPTPAEDAALTAEINAMLAELAAVNDPRAAVQPRTEETGDDGVHRTETIVGYHRRVRAVYQQVKKLQSMGVIT